jgi:peptide/nickel transport system permease protein
MSNRRRSVVSVVFLSLFLLAPWIAPYDPLHQYRDQAGHPPSCGQPCFLLGSDELGRDVLSRLLHGGRLSLFVGLCASALAVCVGGLLGGIAGYFGGWTDQLLSRPVDLLLSLPWLYLLLALRAALPLSLPAETALLLLMLLLALAGAATPFRLSRQVIRAARDGEPVKAARGLGATHWYLLRAHLWPAAVPALRAQALTLFPSFVLAEVSLSFLGLGPGDPAVSWGGILASLRQYSVLTSLWWMFSPAVALAVFLLILPAPRLGWRDTE